MKKKVLVVVLALAMLVAVAVPAMAASTPAGPAASAVMDKSNNVTITVKDGAATVSDVFPDAYVKNGTIVYDVKGYSVEIRYNGSGVNKVSFIGMTPAPVVQPAPTNDPAPASEKRVVEVEQSWSKTTFHCNYTSGNGRVWPEIGPYNKNHDGKIILVLQEIPGTTEWYLTDVLDAATRVSYGVPVCPGKHEYCGCDDWITFSNNSGVPDGNNIQLQHGSPNDPPPPELFGNFDIQKNVDGIDINTWISDKSYDIEDVIAGFELYKVDAKDAPVADDAAPIATTNVVNLLSMISFPAPAGGWEDGWYAIKENLTDFGKTVFEAPSIKYVQIQVVNNNPVNISGGAVATTTAPVGPFTGVLGEPKYQLAGLAHDGTIYAYTAVADASWANYWKTTVWPQSTDFKTLSDLLVYRLSVKDGNDNEFTSFCANIYDHVYIGNLIDGQIATPEQKEKLIAALDWIYANYGSFETLDDYQYAIAQMLVWSILFDFDEITIAKAGDSQFITDTLATVKDILSKYESAYAARVASGAARVTDILELVSVAANGQPQIIPIIGGGGDSFNNKTVPPADPFTTLTIAKTVDGISIDTWISDKNYSYSDLIQEFDLYSVAAKGDPVDGIAPIATCAVDASFLGSMKFVADLPDGVYAVKEVLTPLGESVFETPDIMYIQIDKGEIVSSTGNNFDYTAEYGGAINANLGQSASFILTDAGEARCGGYVPSVSKDGNVYTNPYFDNFKVKALTGATAGTVYSSFCADWFSGGLVADSYTDMSAVRFAGADGAAIKANIIKAFNYINNQGGLEQYPDNKFVANMVLWSLLNDGVDQIWATDRPDLTARVNEVLDFVANGKFVDTDRQDITDVVFLAQDGYTVNHEEYLGYQPQLVPVYGTFDNKEKTELFGTMNASFAIDGTRNVLEQTYKEVPNTQSAKGSITADARGSTTATWFGGTLVNVADAKDAPVNVPQLRTGNGDGDTIATGYNISIDENGEVWIDLLDINTASVSVQLLPINSAGLGVQNNNGHHDTMSGAFDTGLNVGDADQVFVYVHFNSLTYFDGTTSWVKDQLVPGDPATESVPYTGTLSLVVKDADGNTVYGPDTPDFSLGMFAIPGDFAPGTYTATLSGDGFAPIVRQATIVNNGDVASFDFGSVTVTYPDRVIDNGPNA